MPQMQTPKLGCLIMAAGNASRFRANKLAAEFDGKPLIRHALDAVPKALFDKGVVVTQYPQFAALAREFGFLPLENPHPDYGISYTIRLGTRELLDCDAILYMVADQPLLTRTTVSHIVEVWRKNTAKIVGAGHDGVRGNPNIFPARYFPELVELQGDRGGNQVIRRHEDDFLLVETPPEELFDCDTPEALQRLQNR